MIFLYLGLLVIIVWLILVKKGIVLGHVIPSDGIEVYKTKIDLIAKLPPLTYGKDVRYFLGHTGFYSIFIKDFSKFGKPLSSPLAKDARSLLKGMFRGIY